MITRGRVVAIVRGMLLTCGGAAALTVPPLLITALAHWVPVPELHWFHANPSSDAPPLGQQLRDWLLTSYHTVRLDLDDRARGVLAIITPLAVSWLGLVWISLATLWCWLSDGLDALHEQAAAWGPRGWIAGLVTSLVLSGGASPASAAAGAQPVGTAPQQPDGARTGEYSTGWAADSPATPGDHTQPPPRQPDVHLPVDIRPDCPRYRVHRGDTLSSIAERELGTLARWHDLARLNRFQLGTHPDHLEPGWIILLPPDAAPNQGPTKVVTVERGDTLWSIAERELGTPNRWGELWDLNVRRTQPDGLRMGLPDRLLPGWHIVVPDEPHNKPPPGFTPTAPVPSRDPFTIDPWPDPFPPAPSAAPDPSRSRPGQASGPAVPSRPPSQSHPSGPGTAPHDHVRPQAVPRGHGVELGAGVFLGLGLAAAISLAVARARLRAHAKYVPGRPYLDYQPGPTVQALHLAHLQAHRDPATHEPRASKHTEATHADQAAVRPRPRSAPSPPVPARAALSVELGLQQEQTVHLDLASCHGLGISGPVEVEAVRALLLQLLSWHTPRAEAPLSIVMTRADANLLLSQPEQPPSTITLVDDLPDAFPILDRASTTAAESRSTQDRGEDGSAATTVLVARAPVEHAYQLSTLLRDHHSTAAVFIGAWPDGVSLTVNPRGVITHTSPDSNHALCGTRVFTAPPHAGGELEPLTPTPRTPLPPHPPPVNLFHDTYGHDPRTPEQTTGDEAGPTRTTTPVSTPPEPEHSAGAAEPLPVVEDHTAGAPQTTSEASDSAQDETAPADAHEAIQARDPHASPLRLHVFGPFRLVWTDPAGSEHELPCTRGQQVLLTYLAIHPDGVDRATLLDQLWGEVTQPTNTANTQLSRLRKHLQQATGGEISTIIDTTPRFRLDPRLVSSDYAEFDHAATQLRHATSPDERHQALHTMLRCHTGPLGAGLDEHDWLTIPRLEAERLYINAIGELARGSVDHDPEHTLHLLESALRDDPSNEALYRDIMRLQHQLGLTHAISRTYTLLTTRLEELDLTPDQQTIALAERLLQQPSSHRKTSPHHDASA